VIPARFKAKKILLASLASIEQIRLDGPAIKRVENAVKIVRNTPAKPTTTANYQRREQCINLMG